jgi:hypothetical protein
MKTNPQPVHVPGTPKGEEQAIDHREPGRDPHRKNYRSARDSTGINSRDRNPIVPVMPSIPPA